MKDTGLYERVLDLKAPWHVTNVELRQEAGEVIVRVEADDTLWGCPKCGARMHLHDWTVRRWRHLDTCQFKTLIEARVPRVKCLDHGTLTGQGPWAEAHSRFTTLFERLAIDRMLDWSISASAKHLKLSGDEADQIKERAVRRGLERKVPVEVRALCIDEKSVGKGHDYVTVVTQLTSNGPIVDHIADGREEEALESDWAGHSPETLAAIRCVSLNLWKAYIPSVAKALPSSMQTITHDPFHVIQHMNGAVDAVRRQEKPLLGKRAGQSLKGTRFMWLYGFENLPDKWAERMKAMKNGKTRTARAWRLKERLRNFYPRENWAQANAFFADWYREAMRSRLDPVKKVARMIRNHLGPVLHFFIHRVTNAYSEGINSRIQARIKLANGYRNRERLKRDLYFHLGGLDLYPAFQ